MKYRIDKLDLTHNPYLTPYAKQLVGQEVDDDKLFRLLAGLLGISLVPLTDGDVGSKVFEGNTETHNDTGSNAHGGAKKPSESKHKRRKRKRYSKKKAS